MQAGTTEDIGPHHGAEGQVLMQSHTSMVALFRLQAANTCILLFADASYVPAAESSQAEPAAQLSTVDPAGPVAAGDGAAASIPATATIPGGEYSTFYIDGCMHNSRAAIWNRPCAQPPCPLLNSVTTPSLPQVVVGSIS